MSFTKFITSFAAVGLAVGSTMTLAAVPAAQAALPQGDGDLTAFAIDGNTTGPNDWDAPYGPGTTPQGNPTSGLLPFWNSASQFKATDVCGLPSDDIFEPSSKIDQLVIDNPFPLLTTGNVGQKKGDLCAAYAATELVDVDGTYHTVLYAAWQRGADPGEVSFFIPLADGTAGNGPGDRIVQFDYDSSSGGRTAASILAWNGSTWVQGDPLEPGVFQGATGPDSTPSFGEFAIDLTAAGVLPPAGPCTTLTAEYAFTRTGNSPRATLEDYVGLPELPSLTNCATLIVDKVATPEPTTPTDFGFTVSQVDGGAVRPGSTSLSGSLLVPGAPSTYPTPGDPVTIPNVLASPDYVVAEDELPSGWTQDTLVCTGTDPLTGQPFTRTLFEGEAGPDTKFPLGPGATVTCTVTNLGPPAVELTKVVLPEGATGWSFDFTITPSNGVAPSATQTVTSSDPTVRWDNLTPGVEYSITEAGATGWQAGDIVCGSGATAGNTFDAEPGQVIECTATNTKLAKLTVVKDASPADGEQFAFSVTNVEGGTFALRDEGSQSFGDLPPGSHTITETLTAAQLGADWNADSVRCVDATYPDDDPIDGTVSVTGASVQVTTRPGSDVTCTFVNVQGASLTIIKEAAPSGTAQTFPFTLTGPEGADIPADDVLLDVNDDPTHLDRVTYGNLPAGTYSVTEAVPGGWTLDSLRCVVDGDDEVGEPDLVAGRVVFGMAAGQDVVCTFENTQLASLSVTKSVLPTSATGWSVDFTISPAPPAPQPATRTATATAPTVGWTGLQPGVQYEVTEAPMPGFINGEVSCNEGSNLVTPEPGEEVSCEVTNTQLASVSVTKSVLPSTATGWSVDFTIAPVPAGQPATRTATAAEPTVAWSDLQPGTAYTVTEAPMPGFEPGALVCDTDNVFTPTPGQAVECAVTNTQLASVSVTKSVLPTSASGWSVDFTISPVPAGQPATRTASAGAPSVAWTGLQPGTAYTVTEGPMPGFVPGSVVCDTDNVFTPTPGQAVACAVTNTQVASVSVTKSVNPTAATGWTVDFTISPAPPGQLPTKTATPGAPTVSWTGLLPGTQYTVSEGAVPGFASGSVSCAGASGTFTPTPGQAVTCAVTNTQLASVSVTKSVDPAGLTGWSVGFTISPVPTGQDATKTALPGAPTVAWTGLQPGIAYTITEGSMPGFTAGPLSCGTGGATFTPGPGEAVACSVTNTADALIAPEEEVDDGAVGGTEDEEIADTGADVLPLVAVALWAALLGGLLLLVSRRRRA